MTTPAQTTVFLAPASPPFAPHLGTIYTWCLLDAGARAYRYLGGTAVVPEAWSLSSRRLDEQLTDTDDHSREHRYRSMVAAAITTARSIQARFGITTDAEPALRDDEPSVRAAIAAAVLELVDEGAITRTTVAEQWCDPCGIALPTTATRQSCFRCHQPMVVRERADWFLTLDFPTILARATQTQWRPPYALHRFRDLTEVNPQVRVGHFGRLIGITSPLDERQMLDPRLVAALYPRMLYARGYRRIVAACGQDIQRKWLTLIYAAAGPTPALHTIINHGVLLAEGRHKMSRYDGATPADLPEAADPIAYRAGLLSASLGRDIVAATIAFDDASRLRAKIVNTIRFLQTQPESGNHDAIDLRQALGPALDHIDSHLANFDFQRAYMALRGAVRTELSTRLIPLIRARGSRHGAWAIGRVHALASIFLGAARW